MKGTNIILDDKNPNQNYKYLTEGFLTFANKHAPLKERD